MNIGIDIDDTISETFEALLPYSQLYTIKDLKRQSNINLNTDTSTHFYIESMNGWTEDESKAFWDKYYAEILKKLNIKKFASEVINKLKQDGHKIYLISARWDIKDDNTKEITKKWLKDNDVVYDGLFLNASDKLKLVIENDIDIFIDDSLKNCKIISENTDIKVFMMTSNANMKFENEKIKRVFSWPEIYSLI